MPVDLDALARRFTLGASEFATSPLYERLCLTIAADRDLLAIAALCRAGQQPPNLVLAAVHFLLLGGVTHELASFYPSVVGARARNPEDVGPVFRSFCLQYREQITALIIHRLVQTNVVKRAAALRLGLAVVARRHAGPVTLIEIGCSAGVHLYFDRYRYDLAGHTWGDSDAAVRIACDWRGPAPPPDLDRLPHIVERVGVDLHPVDPADPVERRWLRALVWPENSHQAELLDRALTTVAEKPPRIIAGDAVEVLPVLAQELPSGVALVVFHAATRAHVPESRRPAFDAAIEGLGRDRPLFWLSLEGSLYADDRVPRRFGTHVLGLRTIIGGQCTTEHLALVDGHAEWMAPLDL